MAFFLYNAILNLILFAVCSAKSPSFGIHLPLFRRGGRFSHHELANLTYLTNVLADIEVKYARSYRAVEGNRLVRRWRDSKSRDENDPEVIEVAGREGRW